MTGHERVGSPGHGENRHRAHARLRSARMNRGRVRPSATGPEVTSPAFVTFTDAYLAVLSQVISSHQHEIATRGNTTQEILNAGFTVADPLTRSPYLAVR